MRLKMLLMMIAFIITACGGNGSNNSATTTGSGSAPGWGGAGGAGSVGQGSGTIKPFGTGSGEWPSGKTDGQSSGIQSPDWGTVPRESPSTRPADNLLAPLLNPEGQGLQQSANPDPTPTPLPPPPPQIQESPASEAGEVTSPDGSPLPQEGDDCVCYSAYAAAHGQDWPYRRCNEPWAGDVNVCLPPGGQNWKPR